MSKPIVVGIDVSKNFSLMCVLSPTTEVLFEGTIHHDETGLKYTVNTLNNFKKKYKTDVVCVMESTAHYHRIVYQYLVRNNFSVIVINPLQSGGTKNLQIRKIKDDKTDAKRLAYMFYLGVLKSAGIMNSSIYDSLKDLTRQHSELSTERLKYSNKLIGLLDQCFPEYHKVFSSVRTKSSISILEKYPTPSLILNAKKDALRRTMAEGSRHKKTSEYTRRKTEALILAAKNSREIMIERESFAPLISLIAATLHRLSDSISLLEKQILELAYSDVYFAESVNLLTTIPGIGQYSAITLLAEIGDIDRFSKPKQLVAFCGLDSATRQSGTFTQSNNHISKRGSPYIRNVLAVCTHVAVHPCIAGKPGNPVLAAYYAEKRQNKPANVALCASMHKMVNYIYAVLRDRKPYEIRSPEAHIEILQNHSKIAA